VGPMPDIQVHAAACAQMAPQKRLCLDLVHEESDEMIRILWHR